MIGASFNSVGMLIFYCNHVKGYVRGKGMNICSRCRKKVLKKIENIIKEDKK